MNFSQNCANYANNEKKIAMYHNTGSFCILMVAMWSHDLLGLGQFPGRINFGETLTIDPPRGDPGHREKYAKREN